MEELIDSQIQELKISLENLAENLTAFLSGSTDIEKTVDLDLPIGRLTRMDAIQQQKMDEASRHQAKIRLSQVNAAIKLIEEDNYGYCRKCENPISIERLRARPEAPFCLRCQSASEKKR